MNASINAKSLPSIFPSGDYKLIHIFSDDKESPMLAIDIGGNVLSSNKDSFGWKFAIIVVVIGMACEIKFCFARIRKLLNK